MHRHGLAVLRHRPASSLHPKRTIVYLLRRIRRNVELSLLPLVTLMLALIRDREDILSLSLSLSLRVNKLKDTDNLKATLSHPCRLEVDTKKIRTIELRHRLVRGTMTMDTPGRRPSTDRASPNRNVVEEGECEFDNYCPDRCRQVIDRDV
jgi:hypothetical protein